MRYTYQGVEQEVRMSASKRTFKENRIQEYINKGLSRDAATFKFHAFYW